MTLELLLHEANTAAFIGQDPQLLDIYRSPDKISDGAGGFTRGGTPVLVASGAFKLASKLQSQLGAQAGQTPNGQSHHPEYTLISTIADFVLAQGDFFDWRGNRYVVTTVHELPNYEGKADVHREGTP